MQSEIFQAFIGYNFDDYGSQLMKTPHSKLEYCKKVFKPIIIKIITYKGLKYLTLHVMSVYNILGSHFKLKY